MTKPNPSSLIVWGDNLFRHFALIFFLQISGSKRMSWIFSLCSPGAYEPLKQSQKKVDNSTSPSCFCFGFDSFDFCGFRILLGLLFKGDPCFIVDETGTKRQFPSRVWRNGEVADWGGTERSVRGSWRGVGVSGHDQARQTKKPISSWLLN